MKGSKRSSSTAPNRGALAFLGANPGGFAFFAAKSNSRFAVQPAILMIFLAAFCTYAGYRSGDFWTVANWQLLVQPMAEAGVIALGMTLVIASGGIDLSVGSIVGVCAVAAALAAQHAGTAVTVLAAITAGAACGAVNGLLVGWAGLSPILVTIGTMIFFGGVALTASAGASYAGLPERLLAFADATLAGVPAALIVFLFVFLICMPLLKGTLWGRYLICCGSNFTAARFSAMPVRSTLFFAYVLQGALCGVAATMMVARLASARADMGQPLMLTAIAAVVLGGTPISGGEASLPGTAAAMALFYVVENGLTLLGVSAFLETALIASLLLAAVTLNRVLQPRRIHA